MRIAPGVPFALAAAALLMAGCGSLDPDAPAEPSAPPTPPPAALLEARHAFDRTVEGSWLPTGQASQAGDNCVVLENGHAIRSLEAVATWEPTTPMAATLRLAVVPGGQPTADAAFAVAEGGSPLRLEWTPAGEPPMLMEVVANHPEQPGATIDQPVRIEVGYRYDSGLAVPRARGDACAQA